MTSASAVLPAPRAALDTAAMPEAVADDEEPNVAGWLRVLMFVVAVVICLGVAGIGGWRSYTAVSLYFGSWTVPVIADGLVVGTTAIRLAALTRGWRVPGSALLTLFSLGGTVYLNIRASHGNGAAQFSHALAPVAYLVLMEMLAFVLKLQLKLKAQTKARLTLLGWLVSPVVTTRAWLLMVRTGEQDPATARAMIQQSIRARSQLLIICPSPWWALIGAAQRARAAALQTVRDGLLTAADVVELLPNGELRMAPVELLMAVNRRSLQLPVAAAGLVVDEGQADDELEDSDDSDDVEPDAPVQLPALPVPAPRAELVPRPSFATAEPVTSGFGQGLLADPQAEPTRTVSDPTSGSTPPAAWSPAPSAAAEPVGEGWPRLGTTKHSYFAAAVRKLEENPSSDLLSLVSSRRIAAGAKLLAEIGESVTVATVRKYSREFAEWKLGRKLSDD